MQQVEITINGFTRRLLVEPDEVLLHTLRDRLNLTGTKCGCEEGACGACTVMLDEKPVLSCLTPTVRCHGRHVVTIEGISDSSPLHPVQRHLVEKGAIQCGYCTPGIVMTAVAVLSRKPDLSEDEVRDMLSGNLCRCTGYTKIIQAVRAAAEEMRE